MNTQTIKFLWKDNRKIIFIHTGIFGTQFLKNTTIGTYCFKEKKVFSIFVATGKIWTFQLELDIKRLEFTTMKTTAFQYMNTKPSATGDDVTKWDFNSELS